MNPKFKIGDVAIYIEPNGTNTYRGMITSVHCSNGKNRYDFECSALPNQPKLYKLGDSELLTYSEYQSKLITASTPSMPYTGSSNNPSAKFAAGDVAIFTDKSLNMSYQVDILSAQLYGSSWGYICSAPQLKIKTIIFEDDLMTKHEWSIHCSNQLKPKAKFQVGDLAYYAPVYSANAFGGTITNAHNHNGKMFYDFSSIALFSPVSWISEDKLMTDKEYMQSQSRSNILVSNLNNGVNVAAMRQIDDYWDSAKPFKTPIGPKCVCGAGAVKDARHSSWCDIKE